MPPERPEEQTADQEQSPCSDAPKKRQINIQLSQDLYDLVESLAKSSEMSVSAWALSRVEQAALGDFVPGENDPLYLIEIEARRKNLHLVTEAVGFARKSAGFAARATEVFERANRELANELENIRGLKQSR